MAHVQGLAPARGFGETTRRDTWWVQPLVTFLGLSTFLVYSTWAAFQGEHYYLDPYLSPFYSPEIFGSSPHAWFGPQPAAWPSWLPFSPALLVLPIPGAFRFTCYYYRGAYYKAFWADPVSCAVGEPRKSYCGEASFPLILQNVHRYVMYLSVVVLAILAYDAWKACWFPNPATGGVQFGLGLGTIILTANTVLIGCYLFGCHSLRHLVGGMCDTLRGNSPRHRVYQCVSHLNKRHMNWAWASLCSVGFSDLYVRMCSMGVWTDWRIF